MKKTIQKIALSITFTFSLLNVIAQDRNVAWIHGLDGNANSWKHYNQIFDKERNLNSLRTTYNTDNGITYSTNKVIGSMDTHYKKGANNPRNLGIGHSMGGLMLRDADRITANGTKKFGGYITVASPNYGAPIANSLLDGSVENAAENACNKLADGPLSQLFALPWGIVSLVDLYSGFILIAIWMIYREKNYTSVVWVFFLMILGNLTTAVYVIYCINNSENDIKKFFLGKNI